MDRLGYLIPDQILDHLAVIKIDIQCLKYTEGRGGGGGAGLIDLGQSPKKIFGRFPKGPPQVSR